jgi:ATP-grasp domain-containing protein
MNILFPQNPMIRKLPEPIFESEFEAATDVGFGCLLFDEDAFSHGDIDGAFERLAEGNGTPLVYRGWIQSEELFHRFHEALAGRGYLLVSSAAQYAEATFFPNYFPKIRDRSPAAVWTDSDDTFQAWSASRKLGDGPFVLKDHVKSAKHQWHDACFIPKESGRENFERIAENLRAEQGKLFHRGFVIRQYVPLKRVGRSPREYPQCEEYRLFFWKRQLLAAAHYHGQPDNSVDWTPFVEIAQRFDAPFFSMDIAQTEAGDWIVVDVGAGECSSLPPSLKPITFYRRLAELTNLEGGKA